ncbi:MAG: hypothetical protein IPL26_16740 [Leptospiraceae bacterium]|nr:hypothetical protein [Leptospiraceae bacterium]
MILRILENANELINSIDRGIARLKKSDQAMGGKPTARCKPQVDAGLTLHKVSYSEKK